MYYRIGFLAFFTSMSILEKGRKNNVGILSFFFFFQLERGYAEGLGFLSVFGMVDVWQPK